MYCEKCGAQIDDDSVFCQKCGEKQADAFDTSKEDNSESSETGKIEVGTMLYVIKPDINLPRVGYKVRVTKKVIVDGKEQIIAQGPYKPDGTPVSKARTMYAIDLSKFSTSPPSQEVVKKGNTNRRRSILYMSLTFSAIFIIAIMIILSVNSSGNYYVVSHPNYHPDIAYIHKDKNCCQKLADSFGGSVMRINPKSKASENLYGQDLTYEDIFSYCPLCGYK